MNKHLIRVAERCDCGDDCCPRCYPSILSDNRRRIDDDTAEERAEQLRERMEDYDAND